MVSLLEMNTFRIDAKAQEVCRFADVETLREISRRVTLDGLSHYILGRGANVLFTRDFPGVIIHPEARGISVVEENSEFVTLRVEAGLEWDDLVWYTVAQDFWGLERLSGIPGSVGASPVQNIGAYGTEVSDVLVNVEVMEIATQRVLVVSAEELQFGYRDSIFKRAWRGTHVVFAVSFRLSRGLKEPFSADRLGIREGEVYEETPSWVRERVLSIRRGKLPEVSELGSAGSFFKNLEIPEEELFRVEQLFPGIPIYPARLGYVKLSSGWLIDQCGWKGYREGSVGVYPRQALVLVNYGGAIGEDIVRLSAKIVDDVYRKSGLRLEPEVNFV